MAYRLRPSSAERWAICAASVQMQERFPETEESDSAREGTACHYVAEQVLRSYVSGSMKLCSDFIDQTAPNGVVIDEAMAEGADLYVMDVLRVCQESGLLQSLQIEQTMQIPRIHASENGGTPDAWVFNPSNLTLDLWDLKYGHGIVEAFENWQEINYVVGVLDLLQLDDRHITVNIHIVQPRGYHPKGSIRTWTVKGSDLRPYANTLHHQGALALQTNPPVQTGKHCKHCAALHACKQGHHASLNAIDVGGSMSVELIPADQLKLHREILKRSSEAIDFRLTSINSQIKALIKQGKPVAGLALDNPPGRLKWKRSDKEIIALGKLLGSNLSKPGVITPTQAKKLIDESVINVYADHPKGKTKIVESTDTKAASVFSKQ